MTFACSTWLLWPISYVHIQLTAMAWQQQRVTLPTCRDVAGVDTAKEELLEVVACLRDSSRYSVLNARMPPGVLLTGVPGTGKTLLGGQHLSTSPG